MTGGDSGKHDLMMEVSLVTVVKDDNRTRMPLTENGVTNQV